MTAKRRIPKITKPRLAGVCDRPRLFRRLDTLSRRHPLVWVSAPAGSGKTTLAATYIGARRLPCLWYQLDIRDGDPSAFFYYLREAAGQFTPRGHATLPLLKPEYASGLEAYTRNFFEKLADLLPDGAWIVLDSYQDLPEEAPLQALLPVGLGALPRAARALVLSRAAAPPGWARLVTEGAMALLEPEELNLTATETRALARSRTGERLGIGSSIALRKKTAGWVAATVLLLEARRGAPSGGAAETRVEPLLFGYLAAEVFGRASREAQRLLVATAILPEIDVSAAEALTAEPRAGQILGDLARRNFFTFRLEGIRPRYRLHPLFREFLLSRAGETLDPDTRRALAHRAADLLVGSGDTDGAAAILQRAGLHDELARLVRAHAPTLAEQGRLASLEAWLRALPDSARERDPWLSYWMGVCRSESPAEARAWFEAAHRAFRERGDTTGTLVAWAGAVSTFTFLWDEVTGLDSWIEEMETFRAVSYVFPSVELEAQVTFQMFAALMLRHPTHPSMDHWLSRATTLLESDARTELRVSAAQNLGMYWFMWRGDLARAERAVEKLRDMVETPRVTDLTRAFWYVGEAHLRAVRGDPIGCLTAVEHGLAFARKTGVLVMQGVLETQGLYGGLYAGDLTTANHYLALAREHGGELAKAVACQNATLAVWIALCAGDVATADSESRKLSLAWETGCELLVAWAEHTLAHVLIEKGNHDGAVACLERCIEWSRRASHAAVLHHALLSLAYAELELGHPADAVPYLREGLQLGREQGYVISPWIGWRKDVMAKLAALALEHEVEVEHVGAMIRASGLSPPEARSAASRWPWSLRIHALGGLEIVRDGARIEFARKMPRKTLGLLRLLVAYGERGATLERLAEDLWPDADGDTAQHALETTMYRLRQLLGDHTALVRHGGRAALDPHRAFVDAWAFEALASKAEGCLARGDPVGALRASAAAIELYRGDLLPDDDRPEIAHAREELRTRTAQLGALSHS